jgi:dynein heavy chain
VATRTSGLFFAISDLANVDPMYQYSLDFYKLLFIQAIATSEKSDDLEVRLGYLNKEFLESLYRKICRSLFAKDKLVFSTMLAMKLMELDDRLNPAELKFFLTGGVSLGDAMPANPTDWIPENKWGEMNRLSKIPKFTGFIEHFLKEFALYKEMYDSSAP